MSRDGWTSQEDYEEALRFFAMLREGGLKSLEGEELTVFERESGGRSLAARSESLSDLLALVQGTVYAVHYQSLPVPYQVVGPAFE